MGSVTVEKCNRYINHVRKVIPRVIELEGQATGYWKQLFLCTYVHVEHIIVYLLH